MARPTRAPYVMAILGIPAAVMRRRRVRMWRHLPLMFEDQLPDEMQQLGLARD